MRAIFIASLLLTVIAVPAKAANYSLMKLAHKLVGGTLSVEAFVNYPPHELITLRSAADCTPEGAAEVDGMINLGMPLHLRALNDYHNGITTWNRKTPEGKEAVEMSFEWSDVYISWTKSSELKQLINHCRIQRGYGVDVMSTKGAINWTKDRINEYKLYLPRVWCNKEVRDWMAANDAEAKRVLPKLEAARDAGVVSHYEFSPLDNPMYTEYKNLEAMHQDVYDDEGHVFRSAADRCDKMGPPPQTLTGSGMDISKEDLWAAINALDEVTWAHETNWYKRLVNAAKTASDAER